MDGHLHPPALPLPRGGPPRHQLPPASVHVADAGGGVRQLRADDAGVQGGDRRWVPLLLIRRCDEYHIVAHRQPNRRGRGDMEYLLGDLEPIQFQRLVNAILVHRFGEQVRITPLRGPDGGRDAETAPGNPYLVSVDTLASGTSNPVSAPLAGRYLFQTKHHRTADSQLTNLRKIVIRDFEDELKRNVLPLEGSDRVDQFFLITNVPASREAFRSLDRVRSSVLGSRKDIHADIWWKDQVVAHLDQMPSLWSSFPDIFPGRQVPVLGHIAGPTSGVLPTVLRLSLDRQYNRDRRVKFRQIELEQSLGRLFVDIDVSIAELPEETRQHLFRLDRVHRVGVEDSDEERPDLISTLNLILNEETTFSRHILLEGGPGQGKSTVTQMVAQIYRAMLLNKRDSEIDLRFLVPTVARLPIRIELRRMGDFFTSYPEKSVEEFLTDVVKKESGGGRIKVSELHRVLSQAPVLLIFDGLDEVGDDELRDLVLTRVSECIERLESGLAADLRVVVTTRPPAISGKRDKLPDFVRFPISVLTQPRVDEYVHRWVSVQNLEEDDQERILQSFSARRNEPHVAALVQNPMQLSVLLHFIRLKGEAFPARRAELYADYFRTVIDRDVEKSVSLRMQRALVVSLHQFLGYKIHALTEAKEADGTLSRLQLLRYVREWLHQQGTKTLNPDQLFTLGEERLGLIVTLRGEGEDARYGYEIQPIREYFAAAFLNEQIIGNAHDFYQEALQRPFWREVALFLAGLRRPNEKADLILRARQLDSDPVDGWRQNGRIATMELIREGVFSEPNHVYTLALDFICELLDPSITPLRRAMDLWDLGEFLSDSDRDRYCPLIIRLLDSYNNCAHWPRIHELYGTAAALLNEHELRNRILAFECPYGQFHAALRLGWAPNWGIEWDTHFLPADFWTKISVEEATSQLIYYFESGEKLGTSCLPTTLHQPLLQRIVARPLYAEVSLSDLGASFGTGARWAVEWLQYDLAVMQVVTESKLAGDDPGGVAALINVVSRPRQIEFGGLESSTASLLKDLLDLTQRATTAATLRDLRGLLKRSLRKLSRKLQAKAFDGWLACFVTRELLTFLTSWWQTEIEEFPDREPLEILPDLDHSFREIVEALAQFQVPLLQPIGYYHPGTFLRVRVEEGGDLVSVSQILLKACITGDPFEPKFLGTIPLASQIIYETLVRGTEHLSTVLATLGDQIQYQYWSFVWRVPSEMSAAIIAVAQNSEDPVVLRTCLWLLAYSPFEEAAGETLLISMVRSCKRMDYFHHVLFSDSRVQYVKPTEGDRVVLTNVARIVKAEFATFDAECVRAALTYLAGAENQKFVNIIDLEDQLGLTTKDLNSA